MRLYLYAFERGLGEEIARELERQAVQSAAKFPVRFQHVGILLDASASMAGHATQALRPMAVALAIRDLLKAASDQVTVVYAGGKQEGGLVRPCGETSLAGKTPGLGNRNRDRKSLHRSDCPLMGDASLMPL